jgi:drug/metabolite transporter, DME family
MPDLAHSSGSRPEGRRPRPPAPAPSRGGSGREGQPAPAIRVVPVLAVLAAASLFGTTGTAQALGPGGTTALGVGAVRLAIGALALAVLACARRPRRGRLWRRHALALVIGGIAVAAYQLSWFAGLRRTGVALGTIVGIGSGPVFAGLIQLVFGRGAPSRAWAIGTVITVVGAGLLAAQGGGASSVDPVGLGCTLAAGLSYAVYAQASKHAIDRGLDGRGAMAGVFGVGAVLLLPLLAVEPLGWLGTVPGLAMALHLGFLTVGLAYGLYGWGLQHLAVPTVVTLTLAEPLVAALLGVALLGERLGPFGGIGAAAVAAGLVVAGQEDGRRSSRP